MTKRGGRQTPNNSEDYEMGRKNAAVNNKERRYWIMCDIVLRVRVTRVINTLRECHTRLYMEL